MAKSPVVGDRVRAFALERRVFTRAEVAAVLGGNAANALNGLVGGDIVRQAVGVYSVAGIRPDDERVLAKIEETGARRLTDEDRAREAAKAEERAAAALDARTKRVESMTDRVAAHIAEHGIASAADLRRRLGQGAAGAAKALLDREEIVRVRDGLWTKPGIDPFGPEMKAYVEANSIELAAVRRELEEVAEISTLLSEGRTQIEWNVSRPAGRGVEVYLNMVGVPSVMARSRNGRVTWCALKSLVSPVAAEHIARMVLNPMPERIGELADLVESGKAPTTVRRRHGGYREYDRGEDEGLDDAPRTRGYTFRDTHVLDPRRLGNGLQEEVVLEIDDREDDRLVTLLTGVPNLHIMTTRLEMADFVARHAGMTLAIERKTSEDLSSSLDDNRLTEQVRRMSEAQIPCCFVIEGGMMGTRSQPLPRLASLQTRLNFGMDMRVLETVDLQHSAYVIVTAIRDFFFGSGTRFDLRPVKQPGISGVERALHMLQTIPGISPTRAAALVERFGSIAGISRATIKEIATIEGIGKKTAESLKDVLHAGEEPWNGK